jgi:predicted RNA-binding protein YlxR (DUF448 family)
MTERDSHPNAAARAAEPRPEKAKATAAVRTCVGCGERVEVGTGEELVRIVRGPDGVVAVDAKGGSAGRGAHVHARGACLEKAATRGLPRSFKAAVTTVARQDGNEPISGASLAAAVVDALDRRIEGFIVSAARSRAVQVGADAATGASARGEAALMLVAVDAAAAADLSAVRAAVSDGRAVAWGTKLEVGALVAGGRKPEGVGVVAITSRKIADALKRAVQARTACAMGGREQKTRRGEDPKAAREAATGPGSTIHAERGA